MMQSSGQKHASIPKDYWTHWTRHIKDDDITLEIPDNIQNKSYTASSSTPLLSDRSRSHSDESNHALSHMWQFIALIFISISSVFSKQSTIFY